MKEISDIYNLHVVDLGLRKIWNASFIDEKNHSHALFSFIVLQRNINWKRMKGKKEICTKSLVPRERWDLDIVFAVTKVV